jgi:hypothetical protein
VARLLRVLSLKLRPKHRKRKAEQRCCWRLSVKEGKGFGIGKLSAKTVDYNDVVWVDKREREEEGG